MGLEASGKAEAETKEFECGRSSVQFGVQLVNDRKIEETEDVLQLR